MASVEQPPVSLRDFVQVQLDELARRLDESAEDRTRIREELQTRVPRSAFDLAINRIETTERQLSRIYGAAAVVVILIAILGVALRYLVG